MGSKRLGARRSCTMPRSATARRANRSLVPGALACASLDTANGCTRSCRAPTDPIGQTSAAKVRQLPAEAVRSFAFDRNLPRLVVVAGTSAAAGLVRRQFFRRASCCGRQTMEDDSFEFNSLLVVELAALLVLVLM